jgi:hypothetical protein
MQLATTDLNSIMLFAYQFTSENNYGALTTTSLPLRISKFCNDILLIEEASLDTYSTKQLVYILYQFAFDISTYPADSENLNAAYSLLEALSHLLTGS